jgi:pilus assembly protein Flp/PilA
MKLEQNTKIERGCFSMITVLKRLVREEDGQGMAEYGLILALVAVAVIAALVALGPAIAEKIQAVSDEIYNAPTP